MAGRQARIVKRRLAAVDRISDACDDLELAAAAVAEARSTASFNAAELDEVLVTLRINLEKLAGLVLRNSDAKGESVGWLRALIGSKKT